MITFKKQFCIILTASIVYIASNAIDNAVSSYFDHTNSHMGRNIYALIMAIIATVISLKVANMN